MPPFFMVVFEFLKNKETPSTDLKKKKYDADKLIWVIGPDQTLALKQLFAVCEQLGIGKLEDFTHSQKFHRTYMSHTLTMAMI
jgi:arginyl-tRNA synthetase